MSPGYNPDAGNHSQYPAQSAPNSPNQALQNVLMPLHEIKGRQEQCQRFLDAYKQTLNVAQSGSIQPQQMQSIYAAVQNQTGRIKEEIKNILQNLRLVVANFNGIKRFNPDDVIGETALFHQLIEKLQQIGSFLHNLLNDPTFSGNSDLLNGERPSLEKAYKWILEEFKNLEFMKQISSQSDSTRSQISRGGSVDLSGAFYPKAPALPPRYDRSGVHNSNMTYGGANSRTFLDRTKPSGAIREAAPANSQSVTKAANMSVHKPSLAPRERLKNEHGLNIIKELGRGGMGVVYIAKDNLGRTVALKRIMNPDPEMLLRFKQEAEALAKASERIRGVPKVYQFFEFMGSLWFTQELEAGASDYKIHPDQIARILFKNEDTEKLSQFSVAFQTLSDFQSQHQDAMLDPENQKQKVEWIAKEQLSMLLDYALQKGISDEQREKLGRLRIIITQQGSSKARYSIHDAHHNPPIKEGIKTLHKVILHSPLVVEEDESERKKRMENRGKGHGTLEDYLKLLSIHEGAISGSDAQKVVQLLREACGDRFPEKEFYEVVKYFEYDLIRTMGQVEQEGMLHRDMKPANVLLSSAGSDIWLYLADHLLYIATAQLDEWEYQEQLQEVINTAKEKCYEVVFEQREPLMKVIDFGLAKSQGTTELRRSMSHPLKDQQEEEGLTCAGQTLGTIAYIPPELMTPNQPEDDQSRRDTYATGILMVEIFTGKKLMPSKNTILNLMTEITVLGASADTYRKNKREGEKNLEPVPLSAVDLNPEYVAFLKEQNPEFLRYLRMMTKFTMNENERKPVRFTEMADKMEQLLRPKNERSLWQNLAYAGIGAVVVTLALAGTWNWYEGYKLRKEGQAIVSKLDDDFDSMDLSDSKYTSQYFAERIAEIQRVRQIYGEGINADLAKRLGEMEERFEMLKLVTVAEEEFKNFQNKLASFRKSPEGQKMLNDAASKSIEFIDFFSEKNFVFDANYEMPNTLPTNFIRGTVTNDEIISYGKQISEMQKKDFNEFALRSAELALFSLNSATQQIEDEKELYDLCMNGSYRTIRMFAYVYLVRIYIEPNRFDALPIETKTFCTHVAIKTFEFWKRLFEYKESLKSRGGIRPEIEEDINTGILFTTEGFKYSFSLEGIDFSSLKSHESGIVK